ncbi:hypothetical protein F8388_006383 [Cannabis sativa]|uniref:AP2/ERF domain-containing protein n=1 Tax=Cannabis sativa TaxID=3483 RepID=A0A7J6F8Z4_CANSA|nr:hypothetical protein F8388_006383 [Cannabis sativa]
MSSSTSASGRRSSIYRGVTRHRWTGRFEAHWAYDSEEAAARTYDLAALKYWVLQQLEFSDRFIYKRMEEMEKVSKEEYLASLRRRSSGF